MIVVDGGGRGQRERARTQGYELIIPELRADQVVPSQRAMPIALTSPATVKEPAAYTFPLTSTTSAYTWPFTPEPSADQLVPSHRAMRFTPTPPAVVNDPPAYTFPLPSVASASTSPFTPEPSADQLKPFQRAMPFVLTPAADNHPPA